MIPSVYQEFLKQVDKNKNLPALYFGDQSISYGELAEQINRVANLILSYDIKSGEKVALAFPPGSGFIVATLACVKLGLIYVPVNIEYPDSYLIDIFNNAEIAALLHEGLDREFVAIYNPININSTCLLEVDQNKCSSPQEDIYMIYTSGSTGKPKGVLIKQESLYQLIEVTRPYYNISQNDIVPLYHSLGFDFSIWEIYATLLNGGILWIVPSDIKKLLPLYFKEILTRKISIVNMTPSVFYHFVKFLLEKNIEISNLALRLVILGGEAFHPYKIREWFSSSLAKEVSIYNMYGITECTVHSTVYCVRSVLENTYDSPIGKPLPGIEAVVFDEKEGVLAPPGKIGELYLSGKQVAKEYFGLPQITADKFIYANLDGAGEKRWFKTGDLVSVNEEGYFNYIARKNGFVKIKGYRINLAEIEYKILLLPGVIECVVCTHTSGTEEFQLLTYVKIEDNLDINTLKDSLKKVVPEFMIPARFIKVNAFPLSENGKIDLKTLEKDYLKNWKDASVTSEDTLIKKIEKVWCEVLEKQEINYDDNFFEAGGDSLLLMSLRYKLKKVLGKDIAITDLIGYPNITSFTQYIESRHENEQ